MYEPGRKLRREPGQFGLPVRQERSRQHQERRLAIALTFQRGQSTHDLDGFSQAHVVGKANAQAQTGEKPQPTEAGLLIFSQRAVEQAAGRNGGQHFRAAHLRQHVAQPAAGIDERPLALFVLLISIRGQIGRRAAKSLMPSMNEMPSSACFSSSFQ